MGTLTFLRRTQKEIEIFGGDVFFDIDGKNVGKLSLQNQDIEVTAGIHTIKIYKTHTFDTFIGFAESTVTVDENEHLMIKYAAPMMVNQPGNIVISEYDKAMERASIKDRENTIERDFNAEVSRKKEQNEKYNNGVKIVIVCAVIFAIIIAIYEMAIMSSF